MFHSSVTPLGHVSDNIIRCTFFSGIISRLAKESCCFHMFPPSPHSTIKTAELDDVVECMGYVRRNKQQAYCCSNDYGLVENEKLQESLQAWWLDVIFSSIMVPWTINHLYSGDFTSSNHGDLHDSSWPYGFVHLQAVPRNHTSVHAIATNLPPIGVIYMTLVGNHPFFGTNMSCFAFGRS